MRKCNSSSITASNLLTETVEQKLSLLRHGTRKRRGRKRNFFGNAVREKLWLQLGIAVRGVEGGKVWKRNEKLTLSAQNNLHSTARNVTQF